MTIKPTEGGYALSINYGGASFECVRPTFEQALKAAVEWMGGL